jgi:pimeloyl-ACP methyl ester carboxylesterase
MVSGPVPRDDMTIASARFVSIPESYAEPIAMEGHGGQRLMLYRLRGSRAGAPVLLFGHACGFAAGAYLPLLLQLREMADVYAYDARGHGGSEQHPEDLSLYGPDDYALDLARVAACAAGERPLYFVGHSMEAASLLRLACCQPQAFAAVKWRAALLFEPPIYPSADRPEIEKVIEKDRMTRLRTRGRRRDWPSREALGAAMNGRGLFREVSPAFLQAYTQAALRPAAGGFTLACPPEIEEATFASFATDSTWRALPQFPDGVGLHIVGGDPDAGAERLWPTVLAPVIAQRLDCGKNGARRFTQLPGRSHLMVQEDPRKARQLIHNLLSTY